MSKNVLFTAPDDYTGRCDPLKCNPLVVTDTGESSLCPNRVALQHVKFINGALPWWYNINCTCSQDVLRRALVKHIDFNGNIKLGYPNSIISITYQGKKTKKEKRLFVESAGRRYFKFRLGIEHGEIFVLECGPQQDIFFPPASKRYKRKTTVSKKFVRHTMSRLKGRAFKLIQNDGSNSIVKVLKTFPASGRQFANDQVILDQPIYIRGIMRFNTDITVVADPKGSPALSLHILGKWPSRGRCDVYDIRHDRRYAVGMRALTNYHAVVVLLGKKGLPHDVIKIIVDFIKTAV